MEKTIEHWPRPQFLHELPPPDAVPQPKMKLTMRSPLLDGCNERHVEAAGVKILMDCDELGVPVPRALQYTKTHGVDGRPGVMVSAATRDANRLSAPDQCWAFFLAYAEDSPQRHDQLAQIDIDHRDWPLGTLVLVRLYGHHSPEAKGMFGRVAKHGRPCTDGVNCIVEFPRPVMDMTFGAARFCHYVDYKNLVKVKDMVWRLVWALMFILGLACTYFFA